MQTTEDKKKLQVFDKNGKVYIPKEIREQFSNCVFWVDVENGKIMLDPIKVED